MLNYIWPICLIVFSNVFYQICAKEVPDKINPLASLVVTYLIGAISSLVLYYATNKNGNLLQEYHKLNWAPFVLGFFYCFIFTTITCPRHFDDRLFYQYKNGRNHL